MMLAKKKKDSFQVIQVFLFIFALKKYVIKINNKFVKERKNMVHQPHKCMGCVRKAEGDD